MSYEPFDPMPEPPIPGGGTFYDSAFGDVMKGTLYLNRDGLGLDHISTIYNGAHFSYDIDRNTGEISGVHGWIHGEDGKQPW